MASVNVAPVLLKGYNTATYTQPTIASATPVAFTTGNSPITLWTVTGSVLARVYGVVGGTAWTSTAATGTASVGVAGNTAVLLPVSTASAAGQFAINAVWIDSTPTVGGELIVPTTFALIDSNIILTIATNSMTAGAIVMYCDWIPVSAGATVV